MEKAVVIGAGVMGTAVAIHLGNNGVQVNLWGTKWDTKALKEMEESRKHQGLGVALPDNVSLYYEDELAEAIRDTKIVIMAVLSSGIEAMTKKIAAHLTEEHYILSVTKGINEEKLCTISELIEESLAEKLKNKVSIIKLGGPLIARELAEGGYVEAVLASKNIEAAKYAKKLYQSPKFKVNISQDLEGVDLCAAFKNVYAISMGIAESLEGNSNNMKAALMARGTIEMGNIVKAYGGDRKTAFGIAGVGDYYVTSQGGRNGIFGRHLGEGKTIEQAMEDMNGLTVEGYATTLNGFKLLEKLEQEGEINIENDAPLLQEIYDVLYKGKKAIDAIDSYWRSEE